MTLREVDAVKQIPDSPLLLRVVAAQQAAA
jgi:hypothetical protein